MTSSDLSSISLFSKTNAVKQFFLWLFLLIALASIWLLHSGQYQQLHPQLTSFIVMIISAASAVLAVLFAISLGAKPINSLKNHLTELNAQYQQDQQASQQLLHLLTDNSNAALVDDNVEPRRIEQNITQSIASLSEWRKYSQSQLLQLSAETYETQATALHLHDVSGHQSQQISSISVQLATQLSALQHTTDVINNSATEQLSQAVTLIQQSQDSCQHLVSDISHTQTQQQQLVECLQHISDDGQHIDNIAQQLQKIAEQSHLLSLNTAIQTAALDNSRFHVIADELQILAEQTEQLAKQLSQHTLTLQSDNSEAMIGVEQQSTQLNNSLQQAQKAHTLLAQMHTTTQALQQQIQQIATDTTKHTQTLNHCADEMKVIEDITQQTLSGATENADALNRLVNKTEVLQQILSRFDSAKSQ